MSFVSLGLKALENGAKYRVVLKGKQLEGIPELSKLISKIDKPVVHIGVNGRGAEGSIYGVKVFAKGDRTKPVAAFAGRIDYRGTDPMLQARGFVRNNSGTGNAIAGSVQLDTAKRLDLEAMEELTVSKKKNMISLLAKSDAVKADVVVDKDGIANYAAIYGHLDDLISGRASLAKHAEQGRQRLSAMLNSINPYNFGASKAESFAVAANPEPLKSFSKDVFNKSYAETLKALKVDDLKYVAPKDVNFVGAIKGKPMPKMSSGKSITDIAKTFNANDLKSAKVTDDFKVLKN